MNNFLRVSIIVVLSSLMVNCVFGQHKTDKRKHNAFFNWGWNAGAYTKSNLHMKGDDYDITFHKIIATDKHTEVSYYNYLHINRVTIPQTNMRLGYFINNNTAIVVGVDHMKYVMRQNQMVNATGEIQHTGAFKKIYNGPIQLTEDFLTFEHTDGLNLLHIGVEKYKTLVPLKTKKILLEWVYGANIGVMVPKTNVKFLDYERTDRFHVSGYGLDCKLALQASFWKHLLIKVEGKLGFINMPDIVLHKNGV
jgi:hypothetical protein